MNNLFLSALQSKNSSRPPVWLMRQAGRYMPEFRALREKVSFMELCRTPELVAQVTLMPIEQLNVDAAILFSDILVVADAFGVGLHFEKGMGPVIDRPVICEKDVVNLPDVDARESLNYVAEGIKAIKPAIDVPLIGFCGAPFTVASYMVEGGSARDLPKTKKWLFSDPKGFHQLLQKITDVTLEYLLLQVDAGVEAIQIFDSWADSLAYPQFHSFALPYVQQLVEGLRKTNVPLILFCRGSSVFAESMASIKPSAISVDWNADLPSLAKRLPEGVAVQGNLDPDVLYGSKETIKKEVTNLLKAMDGHPGYIFNLGHGLKPDMTVDAVKTLVDTVLSYEPSLSPSMLS